MAAVQLVVVWIGCLLIFSLLIFAQPQSQSQSQSQAQSQSQSQQQSHQVEANVDMDLEEWTVSAAGHSLSNSPASGIQVQAQRGKRVKNQKKRTGNKKYQTPAESHFDKGKRKKKKKKWNGNMAEQMHEHVLAALQHLENSGNSSEYGKHMQKKNGSGDGAKLSIAVGILIVGAGPTGLGAATRLQQHGRSHDFHTRHLLHSLQDEANKRFHTTTAKPWLLIDQNGEGPGGLSRTDITKEGFLFDRGGHVIFSHYRYFDAVLNASMDHRYKQRALRRKQPEREEKEAEESDNSDQEMREWNVHRRVSNVWIRNTFVPYPFQNHLQYLPSKERAECLAGLIRAGKAREEKEKEKGKQKEKEKEKEKEKSETPISEITFDKWIVNRMGEEIADLFMRPYNFKVWATPTTEMQSRWLGERVAAPNVTKAIENAKKFISSSEKQTVDNWGPNRMFRFPGFGGTGEIWRGIAELLPATQQRYGRDYKVIAINVLAKTATLQGGETIQYSKLVSTMPLDLLLTMIAETSPGISASERQLLRQWATTLFHSSTHVIGVGVRGQPAPSIRKQAWMYFPEQNCPFYRATVFSNYARANVPTDDTVLPTLRYAQSNITHAQREQVSENTREAGPYWSLMLEVAESKKKPVDWSSAHAASEKYAGIYRCSKAGACAHEALPLVVEATLQGALNTHLLQADNEIVSLHHIRFEHGYPTPSLERDGILREALPWLKERGIWSRGRFGGYKYEAGNQDHSMMQGVQAADNILFGSKGEEIMFHEPDHANSQYNAKPVWP